MQKQTVILPFKIYMKLYSSSINRLMKQINPLTKKKFKNSTIVTIGAFDGVHIGHQKIIKTLVKKAKEEDLESVVLTFFPHPRMVLQKDAHIQLINTIDERAEKLKSLMLDYLVVEEFTKEFSRLTAFSFVKNILVDKLKCKQVIIGYDHRFGRNRSADINDLKAFGKEFGFKVDEISAQDINEVAVSSTKIRHALNEGYIEKANSYLGYNFMLSGIISKGKGIGKTIGFPTANLFIEEPYKLIPKNGVYAVSSFYNEEKLFGMMNIGTNPTVNGTSQSIEIHFFNFNKDIYNESFQINMHTRLRDEEKFKSIDALKQQLKIDKDNAIKYFEKHES